MPTPATQVEQNEGVWQPTGRLVSGQPAVYTTYVRPDAAHTSYYTGLMWLDTKLLRANYIVGTEQPGGGNNPWGSEIPASQRDTTIAAFNSGFKMDTANGGAYLDGQAIVPLRAGSASLVINRTAAPTSGCGARPAMSPDPGGTAEPGCSSSTPATGPLMREGDTSVPGRRWAAASTCSGRASG